MGYQLLRLPPTTPTRVTLVIRQALEPQFRDIHSMFRLPLNADGVNAGCNFVIAHSLLALVSGVSVTLFEQQGSASEIFQRFMNDIYWKIDPPAGIETDKASKLLYSEFRNPLTHVLGIATEIDPRTKTRIVKRRELRLVIKKYEGLSEDVLELREASEQRPKMSATLKVHGKTATLLVDGLYWGLRRALERMANDGARMAQAETFLSSK